MTEVDSKTIEVSEENKVEKIDWMRDIHKVISEKVEATLEISKISLAK